MCLASPEPFLAINSILHFHPLFSFSLHLKMSFHLKIAPFEGLLLTPERSVPSSPTLSTAVVTHTNATTKHLHTNDPSAVDFVELTRLLQTVASCSNRNKKTTSISSSSSSTNSSSIHYPNTPPQFIFKKPLYNQYYHQTHFHHGLLTPIQTTHNNSSIIDLKRLFMHSPVEEEHANGFKQNISGRYGQWGKIYKKNEAFCGII